MDEQAEHEKELTIIAARIAMESATSFARDKFADEDTRMQLVVRSLMLASAYCFQDTPSGKGDFLTCGKAAWLAAQQLKKEQADASA